MRGRWRGCEGAPAHGKKSAATIGAMTRPTLSLIAAVARNRAIGKDNQLLVRLLMNDDLAQAALVETWLAIHATPQSPACVVPAV